MATRVVSFAEGKLKFWVQDWPMCIGSGGPPTSLLTQSYCLPLSSHGDEGWGQTKAKQHGAYI